MKKTILLSISLLTSFGSFSNEVTHVDNKNTRQLATEIGVTDEQRKVMSSLYIEYKDNMDRLPLSMLISIREQQFELLTEENIDIESISNFIDRVHQYEKEMVIEEMKLKNKIFNILEPVQKEKLIRIFYKDLMR